MHFVQNDSVFVVNCVTRVIDTSDAISSKVPFDHWQKDNIFYEH